MSSPVPIRSPQRRNAQNAIPESDSDEELADISMTSNKENVESPPKESSPPKQSRRTSLAPLNPNVSTALGGPRLEAPSLDHPPPSPRQKFSFNGPDIIALSPRKANKASTINHFTQEKQGEPITRLVIEKLVLTNFKSYAGVQVIGPFHTSFSAVVGPNGSGKSNVIDSMLFVFGFRANKMRQGKLSELIHNSETAPNLQSCSVDIHFKHVTDNLDNSTSVVAGSELVISRKAFKNNSSEYFISGKKSNYTDVTTLLKEKGIDLDHKRFLILQGEVESIAQMKPKAERENDDGLLEYLEDIIGTSNYKATIEESFKKVEELNEVCQEKENRFKIVEKEKDSLESSKDEALVFLKKEKELLEHNSHLFQYKGYQAKESIELNTKILNDLKEALNHENSKSGDFEQEVDRLEKVYNEQLLKIKETSTTIQKLQDVFKKGDREKVAIEEKKKSLDGKKRKMEKLLATANHAVSEADAKFQTLSTEDDAQQAELAQLKGDLSKEKAILDEIRVDLTDKTKALNEEIAQYEQKLQPWNTRIEEKKAEISIAESQLQMLQEQRLQSEKEIDLYKQRIEKIVEEGKGNETKLVTLKREQVHVNQQIKLGEGECSHASKKLSEMNSALSNHRQKTLDARSSIATVQNKNKVLSALMRLQNTGRIQGFHGRLGDLGYIDDKYDIAISTACGQLDDMVVETVEVGQQCIEYLRKNNLGYARFILLNKLRKFNLNPINTPQNVPRLFDLVQPKDPMFAPAFYSVLMDTLVTDNLKQANSVAYGARRYRVVTTDGKLIDKSGTLSGGGNYVNKGGMKSTSEAGAISEKEVLELEAELAQKESKFELAQNTYYEMTNALKGLKDRKPEIETQISKVNFEIESLSNELKNSQVQLEELSKSNQEINSNNKDIDESERKIMKLKAEYDELKDQSKELEDKINELQEKIMQIGGVKLRMQSSKVDGVTQKIEIVSKKMKNNKITTIKLENELKRFKKSKTEKEQAIQELEKSLMQVDEEYHAKISQFESIEAELDNLQDTKDQLTSTSEKLKESLDEKLATINELRSAQIELENGIEKHQGILKQETKRFEHYAKEFRALHERDVSNLISFLESDQRENYECPSLSELLPDEIKALDINKIESETEELHQFISKAKVNVEILEEYGKRASEHSDRRSDLNDAVERRDDMKKLTEELKKRRLDEFMEGFNVISSTLKEMYQMITMGGNAELELVDSLDPFSEGILFSVMPPKKSWKNISNLSGGEKTLSSLALVFALHRYKPTPLYVMDEIDAALDFRNVSIVANYIKERTKNAQFIVISLRNNMFELAQQLVGIYKVSNMTRSITLQNRDLLGNDTSG